MSSTAVATAAGDQDAPRPERIDSAHAVVKASGLPSRLADLVLSVTGKCRLWNRERIEVARELCAHFRDGLEAGVAPDELASTFGDPVHAARLISATRRRLRPLWWRSLRATLRASAAIFLVVGALYAVLAARFFLVSPNVTRNFSAELNAAVLATPEADRAWPLYIQAKRQFGPMPEFMTDQNAAEPMSPDEPRWNEMTAWLDEHAEALATLRAASAKAMVGHVFSPELDPEYAKAMEVTNPGFKYEDLPGTRAENPLVIGLLLPQLGEMRRSAKWLRADAALAASRSDRARFLDDVNAILGIAGQALRDRFVISQLVGLAVADLAAIVVLDHLERPDFLTDDDLRTLAHRLAAFGGGRVSIDTSVEMLSVEDVLQRFYSDDGNGDGHFIGGGNELARIERDFGIARARGAAVLRAYQPLQSLWMPSRAELREKAQKVVATAALDDALPPWRADERTADALYLDVLQSGVHPAMPALSSLYQVDENGAGMFASAFASRDIFATKRDAALIVIAAESYRRAHNGAWPATISELVPQYLPSTPLDPFDGKPLRYVAPKSASERPVIYSVGVDRVDDGGKLAATEGGRFTVHNLKWLAKFRRPEAGVTPEARKTMDEARADWVIWPKPSPLAKDTKN